MDKIRAKRMAIELKGQVFNKWKVGGLIDCGKSALVLHAEPIDRAEPKSVIKIFDPEIVDNFGSAIQLERIEREKSLSGHGHPNLVDIYDGGTQQVGNATYYFIVMEYVPGDTLTNLIGKLSVEEIIKIISDVALAARFLEDRSIVHRDIKPDNIRVKSGTKKQAVLLDLGVIRPFKAKSITDDEFKKNFIATLRYSPPELLMREEDGTPEGWRAVTFYQLGGVLHDMIMTTPLFEEFSDPYSRLVNAVQTTKPIIANGSVPRGMVCLAQNCLIKSPKTRLDVLTWEDFFTIGQEPKTLEDLKSKIRKHQVVSQSEIAKPVLRADNLQEKSIRRLLAIAEKITDSIRDECVKEKKIFPPVECHLEALDDGVTAKSLLSFSKYDSKALYGYLSISLLLKHIDKTDDIFQIFFRSKISGHKLELTDFDDTGFMPVYKGNFDISIIKESLLIIVYGLFYSAVEEFEIKRNQKHDVSPYISEIFLQEIL